MLTKRFPYSSKASGVLGDGALLGQINESLHHKVLSNVQLAASKFVLRMDYDKAALPAGHAYKIAHPLTVLATY